MLRIEEKTSPNGDKYSTFWIGKEQIGTATKRDGGWLVHGKRKPVETERHAAKQMLDGHMNRCMVEHEKYRKLLQKLGGS